MTPKRFLYDLMCLIWFILVSESDFEIYRNFRYLSQIEKP